MRGPRTSTSAGAQAPTSIARSSSSTRARAPPQGALEAILARRRDRLPGQHRLLSAPRSDVRADAAVPHRLPRAPEPRLDHHQRSAHPPRRRAARRALAARGRPRQPQRGLRRRRRGSQDRALRQPPFQPLRGHAPDRGRGRLHRHPHRPGDSRAQRHRYPDAARAREGSRSLPRGDHPVTLALRGAPRLVCRARPTADPARAAASPTPAQGVAPTDADPEGDGNGGEDADADADADADGAADGASLVGFRQA